MSDSETQSPWIPGVTSGSQDLFVTDSDSDSQDYSSQDLNQPSPVFHSHRWKIPRITYEVVSILVCTNLHAFISMYAFSLYQIFSSIVNEINIYICNEDKLQSFYNTPVSFPTPRDTATKKRRIDVLEHSNIETLKNVTLNLAEELKDRRDQNQQLKASVCTLATKVKAQQQSKLKIKRRAEKTMLQPYLKLQKAQRKVVAVKNIELKRLRSKVVYLQRKITKMERKYANLQNRTTELEYDIEGLQKENNINKETIKTLEIEKKDLIGENEWLQGMVKDEIPTYDDSTHSYTTDMQQCVYSLLSHNVSTTKIPLVIRDVLQLGKMSASHLPCKSTCNNMNIQRLSIAQKQLADEFSEKQNTCILSDETSKFGQKYEGFHAVDDEGRVWMLGLRQMATKSGQDVMDTFKEILNDIDDSSDVATNDVSKAIMKNIVATMSDRASTQMKFNELLKEFRTEVLKVQLPWDDMNEEEKMRVSRLCNFFCSLHVLVHLAEAAEKSLIETENLIFEKNPPIFDMSFKKVNESGTTRLVRTTSKAFSRGGDDKNGAHGPFMAFASQYLKQKGFRALPLERFRGNRFNILFNNASCVYFLHDYIVRFLNGGDSNKLLKSVKHDFGIPEYIGGCRALGLVSELITKPLWSLIENKTISILDMKCYYVEIMDYLQNLNFRNFISGSVHLSFVNEEHLASSAVYEKLIVPTDTDNQLIAVLQVMIPSLARVMQKLFQDYLPGGKWAEVTDNDLKEKLKATPKHNKFSETVFGQLDRLLREKPNISIITSEAILSFCHNKTMDWLQNKEESERKEICASARKSVKQLRAQYHQRLHLIQEETRRRVEEKLAQEAACEEKRIKKMESYVNDIQVWGLWQSPSEVHSALNILKTQKDKISALKAQLSFRKFVFQQKVDPNIYSFTKKVGVKRVNLSVEELKDNVITLVKHSLCA